MDERFKGYSKRKYCVINNTVILLPLFSRKVILSPKDSQLLHRSYRDYEMPNWKGTKSQQSLEIKSIRIAYQPPSHTCRAALPQTSVFSISPPEVKGLTSNPRGNIGPNRKTTKSSWKKIIFTDIRAITVLIFLSRISNYLLCEYLNWLATNAVNVG